jgi:4-amino-4-deoxy-L-arabinose transferase-like glycosyltransferase
MPEGLADTLLGEADPEGRLSYDQPRQAPGETPKRLAHRLRLTTPRALLILIAGLAGLSYAWGISQDGWEAFYAGAVRSMASNWHDFFFGAVDPAGTITLDKLPGAFWIQALSVRVFGYSTWALVLPQVVEGVLTVLVLYRAVNRLYGTTAALIAAFILAASPAVVALNRGNLADTAMVLFLVLAADAVSAAIVSGKQRHLVVAGLWVGIAFQTKMLEAWIVLPAFGLAYLFARPEGWLRKLRQVAIGGVVAAVVSLSWMTAVTLTPAHDRPYIDGSQHNSIYEQVLVYNGFGRSGEQSGFNNFTGTLHLSPRVLNGPPRAWDRLFQGDIGRDTGWLLPTALLVGSGGLFTRRRGYFILWAGWLVSMVAVFSDVFILKSTYTPALAPPVAAILGGGIASLWESRHEARSLAVRHRVAAAAIATGTIGYSIWLIRSTGSNAPLWLWPLAVSVGAVAVVLLVASAAMSTLRWLLAVALTIATAAIIVIPASASGVLVANGQGYADTPFESAKTVAVNDALLGASSSKSIGALLPTFEKLSGNSPYVMAVYTSAVAATFIAASGKEILPIGGFTGTIPEPTTGQLASMIREGKFHLVLLTGGHDPRLTWIASHCSHPGQGRSTSGLFFCMPKDA